jgi:molybdate transport system regulatory protein
MAISARNVFGGIVTAFREGPVQAEIEITTDGGDVVAAIISSRSAAGLNLAVGKPATAFIKASGVVLVASESGLRFSARNQLTGTVAHLAKGAINTDVSLQLPGGSNIHAVITNAAADELGLVTGATATALFKANAVMVAVPA